MVTHTLKSWVGLFDPIRLGLKTHDLRVLDRDYKVGDRCLLREWKVKEQEYTGSALLVEITYITSSVHEPCAFSGFALHPNTGILSIRKLDVAEYTKENHRALDSHLDYVGVPR